MISGNVLITMGMTTNNDWLSPAWNYSWYVLADDGLSEDGTVKNVSDGSVRRFPHFLQFEFFHSFLIRSNSSALNTNLVLFNGMSGINCNLIVSLVSVLNA